ncbi:MAG: hypothetical protein WC810_21655, partial [Janthinobacterium sp.]
MRISWEGEGHAIAGSCLFSLVNHHTSNKIECNEFHDFNDLYFWRKCHHGPEFTRKQAVLLCCAGKSLIFQCCKK